jgi:prepilin-type processing-associated H-X9-DG protein/prepilin-type N-terminal cleavage/methylation domain-containing protein
MLLDNRPVMRISRYRADAGSSRNVGFTLIELLVVIAIIAMLAALLLPVLARGRAAADSAVCKGNLHQWGLALRMYVDEEKAYPTDWIDQIGTATEQTRFDPRHWYKRLERYTGARWPQSDPPDVRYETDRGVALCPGFRRLPNACFGDFSGSYGYNGTGIIRWGLIAGAYRGSLESFPPPDPTVKESQVVSPSAMIAVGDAPIWTALARTWGDINFSPLDSAGSAGMWAELGIGVFNNVPGPASWGRLTRRRHNGRFNVVFCDGHVENLRPQNLFEVRNDEVLRLWNRDNQPHRELVPWDQ